MRCARRSRTQKTGLYSMNAAAADLFAVATLSQAQAGAIVAPQSYPSLANTFSSVLSPFASAFKTNSQAMYPVNGATGNPGVNSL
jgi:hypothetical protein